jgi:tetratricopeptide (TPR) repeat protein
MEQQRRCSNSDNRLDLDAALAGCAAAIESGRLSGAGLAIVWYNRGSNYLRRGNADQAISALTESIRLNPGYAPAFSNRGVAYRMAGYDATDRSQRLRLWELAISDYGEAIRRDPNNAASLGNRGAAHFLLGHDNEALADLNESIRLAPGVAEPLMIRCLLRLRRRAFVGAWVDCDASVHIQENPVALYARGLAASRFGRPDGQADIARAQAIAPNVAQQLATLSSP